MFSLASAHLLHVERSLNIHWESLIFLLSGLSLQKTAHCSCTSICYQKWYFVDIAIESSTWYAVFADLGTKFTYVTMLPFQLKLLVRFGIISPSLVISATSMAATHVQIVSSLISKIEKHVRLVYKRLITFWLMENLLLFWYSNCWHLNMPTYYVGRNFDKLSGRFNADRCIFFNWSARRSVFTHMFPTMVSFTPPYVPAFLTLTHRMRKMFAIGSLHEPFSVGLEILRIRFSRRRFVIRHRFAYCT